MVTNRKSTLCLWWQCALGDAASRVKHTENPCKAISDKTQGNNIQRQISDKFHSFYSWKRCTLHRLLLYRHLGLKRGGGGSLREWFTFSFPLLNGYIPKIYNPSHYFSINSLATGDLDAIFKMKYSILFYWLVFTDLLSMPSNECHGTVLMISQNWFRYWFGAVRQQSIIWVNTDPDLWHHMVSSRHNVLIKTTTS